MNYPKIIKQLQKESLVDERGLICHSYRTYSSSSKMNKKICNDKMMPSFMVLSINEDKLNISYAGGFGGFKKYYASFKLANLVFQQKENVDKLVDCYQFSVLDDVKTYLGEFYIIILKHKKEAEKLIDAIINYNK